MPPPLNRSSVLMLVLALALLASMASAELLLVYSIQRHGARDVLPKSSLLRESSAYGGPALLPAGKKQCYEAGKAFRERYLNPQTCNATMVAAAGGAGTCLTPLGGASWPDASYSNHDLLANSSALHRTIVSATSFFLGAFGDGAVKQGEEAPYLAVPMVPVFSVGEEQDVAIRPYTKCPTYRRKLARWYQSAEFKQKEADTEEVRARVAALAPGLNTSLTQFWNVFDAFNVWRTNKVGEPMPDLPADLFQQVVDIATWLETAKMRSALAGNLLGGVLLADVVGRIEAAARAVQDGFPSAYYRFLSVSGHYSTQLGVLAALGADQAQGSDQVPWFGAKLPSPAAVLAFELHRREQEGLVVRLVLQDGPGAPYQVVPLPCSVAAGSGFCPLDRFLALAGPQAMSPREWCRACDNTEVLICRAGPGAGH